ncbi:hypothetical protein EDD85DRAFT_793616 [Armillaria nabsnona]|nr:hypothetical protein EDD85DRAFT_793616 [Armillaria nabsnona]
MKQESLSRTPVKDVLFSLLLVIAILRGETGYAVSMTSLLHINDPTDDPQLPLWNKVDAEPTGRFLNVALFDPGVTYIYSFGRIDLEAGPTRLHTLKSFHRSQIRAHGEKRGPGAVNEALSRWTVPVMRVFSFRCFCVILALEFRSTVGRRKEGLIDPIRDAFGKYLEMPITSSVDFAQDECPYLENSAEDPSPLCTYQCHTVLGTSSPES